MTNPAGIIRRGKKGGKMSDKEERNCKEKVEGEYERKLKQYAKIFLCEYYPDIPPDCMEAKSCEVCDRTIKFEELIELVRQDVRSKYNIERESKTAINDTCSHCLKAGKLAGLKEARDIVDKMHPAEFMDNDKNWLDVSEIFDKLDEQIKKIKES